MRCVLKAPRGRNARYRSVVPTVEAAVSAIKKGQRIVAP